MTEICLIGQGKLNNGMLYQMYKLEQIMPYYAYIWEPGSDITDLLTAPYFVTGATMVALDRSLKVWGSLPPTIEEVDHNS